MENLLNLEEKITCGKIKSKAKTIFIGNLNKVNNQNEDNGENIIFPSINVDKFIIKYGNSNDFNLLCSHLLNSTIIISNSSNPKESTSHILVLPGYLTVINKLDNYQINLHINFKNFFPSNIPTNINSLYFMIWFKNLLPEGIVNQIDMKYILENTQINKSNLIDDNKYLTIQQTQTFNVLCGNKTSEQVIKKTNFNNMCRAFWIKFNILDYNNLIEFKIELNGHTRLVMTKNLVEMMCEKKIINSNYLLLFVNLELGNGDWFLPIDLNVISQIYLNSCNMSRIDTIKFYFKFSNKYTNDNIQITSLSVNNLRFTDNNIRWKYFL